MELVVSGWSRDHGEKVIAKRDLTEARSSSSGGYVCPEVYVTTTEGREAGPLGVHVVENGNVELRFYAKITLNGEYLVRQTISRREIARLFLAQYNDCSFQELLGVINEVRESQWSRSNRYPPVMKKDVNDIGLSEPVVKWLKKSSIWRIGDLVQKTESQIRSLPGFEHEAFFEIRDRLIPLGLQYGMKVHDWPNVSPQLMLEVSDIDFTVRTANCLKNEKIVYVGELIQKTEAELLRAPNFGRKSLHEIKGELAKMGLSLGTDVPGWQV